MISKRHLGGHANITHTDEGALTFLIERFKIRSVWDVGCGPGGMVKLARAKGLNAIGIDGDLRLPVSDLIFRHDFYESNLPENFKQVDLIWSVEFLEHVAKAHLYKVFDTFKRAQYVLVTHALPDPKDTNPLHVNLRPESYWIKLFDKNGFDFDEVETMNVRNASTMEREFMRNTGKLFVRR